MTTGVPLIAWYGDDFTGSTDALEVLARGGLKAVLFLDQPDEEAARQFADAQAIGLAGIGRSQSPEWMSRHLPGLFEWLRSTHARVCHYKVCSTFDSSPEIGNIGRAMEIGRRVFDGRLVPVVAGAPALRRFTAFGNLFASAGTEVFRIDRHPAMSRHPVTPMREADLRRHLAQQTSLRVGLVSLPQMLAGEASERLREIEQSGMEAALLDVFDEQSLLEAGRAIWPAQGDPARFVAGSSGVEYSLIAHWRSAGLLPSAAVSPKPKPTGPMVVLSGSCSPGTSRQIHHAIQAGYTALRIDPASHSQDLARSAVEALGGGRSVVLYTALDGVAAPVPVDAGRRIVFSEELGSFCGKLLRTILLESGVHRAVIAGGDTSSHAGRQLGLRALTFKAPVAPGAPLCEAYSADSRLNGLEIVFKGGQIGDDNFFEFVRTGEP